MRETYSWNMKPVELAVVVALNVKPKKLTQLEIGRMEYNYLVISHRLRCRLDQELTLSVYCAYIYHFKFSEHIQNNKKSLPT